MWQILYIQPINSNFPHNFKDTLMKTINQIIEENLKKIRELSGFTQEQIAKSIS